MASDIQIILKNLESDLPEIQDKAIQQLEQMGTPEAVVILARCLDKREWRQEKGFDPQQRGPKGERPLGREVYEPLSFLAAKALARLVPNPPVPPKETFITEEYIEAWKAWWAENRSEYDSGGQKS